MKDRLVARHAGGPLPLVRARREVHVVDATYTLDVTWFRRRLTFAYHSPRIPRGAHRTGGS